MDLVFRVDLAMIANALELVRSASRSRFLVSFRVHCTRAVSSPRSQKSTPVRLDRVRGWFRPHG